jgi:hypothetical protein
MGGVVVFFYIIFFVVVFVEVPKGINKCIPPENPQKKTNKKE